MPAPKKKAEVAPEPDRVIDLDQARAARAEARGDKEAPRIKLENRHWQLPAECPLDFITEIEFGNFRQAFTHVFDEEVCEEFLAIKLSIDDFEVLAEGALAVYGVDKGK